MNAPLRLLVAALCALSGTACATQPLVGLTVVDRDNGSTLPNYNHHGRNYIPGIPGHRYSLHLYNYAGERVMVVLSVDGVNAVSGQTAATNQTGYVLGPWQSADIDGWRKSDYDVAQFVFTALEDSYAARTGRPDNVGVIGMAVFRERRPEPIYVPPQPTYDMSSDSDEVGAAVRSQSRRDAAPAPSAAPAPPSAGTLAAKAARASEAESRLADGYGGRVRQEIGTGHGDRQYSPISRTSFERLSSSPQQVTRIWYDTPQQLAARGIMPRWYPRPPRDSGPQAFPVGYVPDPPARW